MGWTDRFSQDYIWAAFLNLQSRLEQEENGSRRTNSKKRKMKMKLYLIGSIIEGYYHCSQRLRTIK